MPHQSTQDRGIEVLDATARRIYRPDVRVTKHLETICLGIEYGGWALWDDSSLYEATTAGRVATNI